MSIYGPNVTPLITSLDFVGIAVPELIMTLAPNTQTAVNMFLKIAGGKTANIYNIPLANESQPQGVSSFSGFHPHLRNRERLNVLEAIRQSPDWTALCQLATNIGIVQIIDGQVQSLGGNDI